MKDTWVKKGLVVSIILLFIGVAVLPNINLSVVKASNDNDLVEVTTHVIENVLGEIKVWWGWLIKPGLNVQFIFTNQTKFYFSEINGEIQMNFTVICRHILENRFFLPRWTVFNVDVYMPVGFFIWHFRSQPIRCRNLTWEYHNITLDKNNQITGIQTHGHNVTLGVSFSVGLFQRYWSIGHDITVIPIPISQ
jgi:hypothetical protein